LAKGGRQRIGEPADGLVAEINHPAEPNKLSIYLAQWLAAAHDRREIHHSEDRRPTTHVIAQDRPLDPTSGFG